MALAGIRAIIRWKTTVGMWEGHHIDVYRPSRAKAKKFGRQRVKVVVLRYGDNEASPPDSQQKAEAKAVNREARVKAKQE